MYDLIRQTIKLLARKFKKMSQLIHLSPTDFDGYSPTENEPREKERKRAISFC